MRLSDLPSRPRLPPAARTRLADAQVAGLWASPLPVRDELALREVGFRPLGAVTASIPSWPFAFRYPPALTRRRSSVRAGTYYPGSAPDDPLSASRLGGFSHDYGGSQTAGIVPDLGWSWQRVVRELQERQLFAAAIDHVCHEATTLGAAGVVGLDLSWVDRPGLSAHEFPVFEVRAVGLAVGTPESTPLRSPFTTTLGGAETALLLKAGLAPVAAVLGVGRVRAELGNVTRQRLRSLDLGEVRQFSEALERTLQLARSDLENQAGQAGEFVVDCRFDTSFERELGAGLEVTCRALGTAVAPFDRQGSVTPLTIIPLK